MPRREWLRRVAGAVSASARRSTPRRRGRHDPGHETERWRGSGRGTSGHPRRAVALVPCRGDRRGLTARQGRLPTPFRIEGGGGRAEPRADHLGHPGRAGRPPSPARRRRASARRRPASRGSPATRDPAPSSVSPAGNSSGVQISGGSKPAARQTAIVPRRSVTPPRAAGGPDTSRRRG